MWEIIITYEDEGTGKRYNRAHRMSNMQFNALKTSGCLEKDIARNCEEAVQEFLWLERHELVAKLLAKNCKSMDELEAAKRHWWRLYNDLRQSQRYSACCISDSENMQEALTNFKDCLARIERVRSGQENI